MCQCMSKLVTDPTGQRCTYIVVIDGSGSRKCVLWEEEFESLKEGECYLLFYNSTFLSMTKVGCELNLRT